MSILREKPVSDDLGINLYDVNVNATTYVLAVKNNLMGIRSGEEDEEAEGKFSEDHRLCSLTVTPDGEEKAKISNSKVEDGHDDTGTNSDVGKH